MINNIKLLKYELVDFEIFKDLVSKDEVMKYITGYGLNDTQATKKFNSILETNETKESLAYFKVFTEDNVFIGDCKLVRYELDTNILEIGYILKKEYWGKGYGTMICALLLRMAKEFDASLKIVGIIDPENIASKRLLEKFGFKSFFIGIEDDLPTEKLMLHP